MWTAVRIVAQTCIEMIRVGYTLVLVDGLSFGDIQDGVGVIITVGEAGADMEGMVAMVTGVMTTR